VFLGTVVGTKLHDLVQARTPGLKVAINTSVTATDEIYLRHIDPPKADIPTFDLP